MKATLIALSAACFLAASPASARVFDFSKEKFAIVVGGGFGTSNAGDTPYSQAGGATTTYDKTIQTTTSASAALLLTFTKFNFVIGVDYLMPRTQEGINGTNPAGTALFSLKSDLSAFVPMAAIEYMGYRGAWSHGLIGVGYGVAIAHLENTYKMESAGTSAFGVTDFKEQGTGVAPLMQGYIGWEFLFSDMATLTFKAGYRYCVVSSFKYTEDVNTITGSKKSGDDLVNMDGGNRSVNLGGGFGGLDFRFYF